MIEKSNNLQTSLKILTQFKCSAKEIERGDFKGFVDRFKQSVGDVRAKQVPAEEMLMTIFRSAVQEQDQFLRGLLKIDNMNDEHHI